MTNPPRTERKPLAAYLVAATVSGYLCGSCFTTWKAAIEPAQVVAGAVSYAEDNPNFMQQVKMYTVVHQGLAVLLRLGLSEWTLCRFLSGLEGSLIFLAVGLPIFALSGRVFLAAGFPFLLVRIFGTTLDGVTYPVFLVDNPQNWGMIGLTFAVVVLGLFLSGRKAAASFCLGVAPAVHPSLGLWLLLSIGLVAVLGRVKDQAAPPVAVAPLIIGLVVSLSAAGIHFFLVPGYPVLPAIDGRSPYFRSEVEVWDMHRAPFDVLGPGMRLVVSAVAVSVLALVPPAEDRARFFARSLLATVVVAALFSIGNWYSGALPGWVMAMMPSRTFNVAVVGFIGLWIGLLAARAEGVVYPVTLTVVLGLLAGGYFHVLLPPLSLAIAMGLERTKVFAGVGPGRGWPRRMAGVQGIALLASFGMVCAPRLSELVHPSPQVAAADPVARVLREGSGLVLVGGDINFVQAWSRRPVLLRGESIDVYAYAPEAGPAVARILARVYGIDYHAPPPELRRRGGLDVNSARDLWQARPTAEWLSLADEFDFTDIVTSKDWRLHLPVAASGAELAVYRLAGVRARGLQSDRSDQADLSARRAR